MKKVLELFGEPFCYGGQEAFIMNILRSIDIRDLKIDFCTPYYFGNESYVEEIHSKGGLTVSFGLSFNEGKLRTNLFLPVFHYLKHNNYDVVHIHSGSVMSLAILSLAAKCAGVKKIIVHSHAAGEKENFKHIISKIVCTPLLDLCPTDYFACSALAAEWKFSKRVINTKVKIIKNGIDLSRFRIDDNVRQKIRDSLGYVESDLVIGHVGRFSEEKNHKFIIDLFYELFKENGRYKLLLVGDGELKDNIIDYSKDKNVFDNIIFTGNIDNVKDYMQAMDLFVLPSKFEGLGIVSIEAQACGLPVVASIGVPKETKVTSNVKFLGFNPLQKWIETIDKMVVSPKLNNYLQIESRGYNIKQTAEQISQIYLG